MTCEVEIEQSAYRTKIGYRFFAGHVEYMIRDRRSNKASFNLKYADLPSKFDYRTVRASWPLLTRVALMAMLLGLIQIVLSPGDPGGLLNSPYVFGAFAIGVAACLREGLKNIYTAIPTRKGNVLVLRDSSHDEVLSELKSRRLRALRELAVIDPQNTPAAELHKFVWLNEEGVISDEELDVNCRMLGFVTEPQPRPALDETPKVSIRQRALRLRTDFIFYKRYIAYEIRYEDTLLGFNIRYRDLPPANDYSTLLKRDRTGRWACRSGRTDSRYHNAKHLFWGN
ncbi:MAG: hypothetical protein ABSG46_17615 [Candidatus Binataceae bacterium]|jgi:hypothetical protein